MEHTGIEYKYITYEGVGPCPECEEDAEIKARRRIGEPGTYYTIYCPTCGYHTFFYDGPDI